ncbi:MAG: DNA replication/repair protein RecF [Clostridia bacterium]|nr:DNA replication/repair protein RecF [Clostridia bacterium]
MICKKASYYRFRNIEASQIEFSDRINVIYGDNAVGKTSAIEGIYLCAQGRSHRTSHEKDYIKFGEDYAAVSLWYEDANRKNELSILWSQKGKRQCRMNDVPIKKMSEFIGNFRAVLFTPEHLSIVKEGPAMRRSFLDNAISQLDKLYVTSLQRYAAILAQRNKIIAESFREPSLLETVDVWSEQLAEEAAVISKKRRIYIDRLSNYVADIFRDMTGGREVPKLVYTGEKTKEEYLSLLQNNLQREIRYGATLFGTHKDDMTIFLNEKEARSYASQGQQRSFSLALKLAEGEISKDESGEYPVFLFDDVLSELDKNRREYIMAGLSGRQVIMTTCEREDVIKNCNLIYASGGRFMKNSAQSEKEW